MNSISRDAASHIGSSVLMHCLTVDVEDYFHVAAFRNSVKRADWEHLPSRVERNTRAVLDLFSELNVKATFFVLGWVAERYPTVVKWIAEGGHELGCHSYSHQLVYELDPERFKHDTIRALDAIEQSSGQRVTKYRAPSFSVTKRSTWALNILLEAGITHDSSIFPIRHDLYGFSSAPRQPFMLRIGGAQLIEFPPSTLRKLGMTLPVTGGGYLRIFPLSYQKMNLHTLEKARVPGMLYLHPWELDPEQPRIKSPLRSRLRHYTGLTRTANRLQKLCGEFRFGPMGAALPDQLPVFELADNGEFRNYGEVVSSIVAGSTYSQQEAQTCI